MNIKNILKTVYRLGMIGMVAYLFSANSDLKNQLANDYVPKVATDTLYAPKQAFADRLNLHQQNFNLLGTVINTQLQLNGDLCTKLKIDNPFVKKGQPEGTPPKK